MVDELPPDDPNTPGETPDAPGRRRARRRDRAARIVGARTAEDLTAERPRPTLPEPPASSPEPPPPPPEPPAPPPPASAAEPPDEEWHDEDDAWAPEHDVTGAAAVDGGVEAETEVEAEADDEEWDEDDWVEEPDEAADADGSADPSHFGAIPVIRPGDPPPPGVEIPPLPGAEPPPPPPAPVEQVWDADDAEGWDDDEWEDEVDEHEVEGADVVALGGDDVPVPPAPLPDAELHDDEDDWDDEDVWEDDEVASADADDAVPDDADEADLDQWEDEPTAAMAAVPPPPPPPPPPPGPPRLEEVPPVEVDDDAEYDDEHDDLVYDEDDELDQDVAAETAAFGDEDLDVHDDEDELQAVPGPPTLRLAEDPPPDEPAPSPWDPAAGEVHDDVSGMPPDDDDLLSSPRGWDDEDDGLDALIPRRTGQHEAIRPDAPPPAVAADEGDLPPWTEPGTGEVPAAVRGEGDDLDAWSGLSSGPRWRDQASEEWESDSFDDLADDDTQVGYDDELDDAEPVVVFDDVAAPGAPPAPPGVPLADVDEPLAPPQEPFPPDPRRGGLLGGGGPPQEPGSDARNLPVAVGVGAGLAVVFLVLMAIRPGAAMLLVVPALVLAAAEFFTAVRKVGYQPVNLLGLVSVAGLALGTFWRGESAMPLVLFLTVVAGLLWYLFVGGERVVANLGITFLGVLWIGLLGSFAALMLSIPQNGTGILTGAILVTVAHDVVGLFVGSRMGRSPLSAASPGKTMEGTIGGVAAAIVMGLLVGVLLSPWDPATGLMLGVVAAVMAPLGDLAESVLKRDLGVKDMGAILPGHGGLLDRFDALLFVLPAAYYVVVINDFLF